MANSDGTPAKGYEVIGDPRHLERVLDQARDERWTQLTFVSSRSRDVFAGYQGWEPRRVLVLSTSLASGLAKLSMLREVRDLRILDCSLGDDGARALASLTGLTTLNLWGNSISDVGARTLASLTDLMSLELWNNLIGDDGARALASLTGLATLNLWKNSIGDVGARALASLTSLTTLDLGRNSIGADGTLALASLTGLTSLDLSDNLIGADGARALASLTGLTRLALGDNSIGDDGAGALASLTSLTTLDLANNSISADGARALAPLTALTTLDLRSNSLGADGARALAPLTALTDLDLGSNSLGPDGARALASLNGLTTLMLRDNSIGDDGARALASLTGLTMLCLSSNSISDDGAQALTSLTGLTLLLLSRNSIGDDGARALASLTGLTTLDLASNSIGDDGARTILDSWDDRGEATQGSLNLCDNGISPSIVPEEILKTESLREIIAAYRAYRDAEAKGDLVPLNEAKLLVVGREAVGKTSLVRYLVEDKPRNESEGKTLGVAHQRIETRKWRPEGENIRLNIWDFGGQEIMRGTHRFFLTRRSLYLLVLNARLEDDRSAYDWLRLIANAGGESPVIVVVNKADMLEVRAPEEAAIRREFANVIAGEFPRTCCDPGEKCRTMIAALREKLFATLRDDPRLADVRNPIPRSWLRVKQALEEKAKSARVLTMNDYRRLCEGTDSNVENRLKVSDPDQQDALLGLLHDVGVIVALGLREGARAAMREVTLLDPNWLTQGVYQLLTHSKIAHQAGVFSRQDIVELLDPTDYPPSRHDFLLETMQLEEIGLCYPLDPPGKDQRFLMPEALSSQEPDHAFPKEGGLRFWFQYDLLPSALVPQFIVRAHPLLPRNPFVWRSGVIFGLEGCRVRVVGNGGKQRVEIAVHGEESARRRALAVVQAHWKPINDRNAGLGCRAMVPIPGQPDTAEAESYAHLLELEKMPGCGLDYKYLPRGCTRMFTVRELLEGVRMVDDVGRRGDDGYRDEGIGGSLRQGIAGSMAGRDMYQITHIHQQPVSEERVMAPSQKIEDVSAGGRIAQTSDATTGDQSIRRVDAAGDIVQQAGAREEKAGVAPPKQSETKREGEAWNFWVLFSVLAVSLAILVIGAAWKSDWLVGIGATTFVLLLVLVLTYRALDRGSLREDTLKAIVGDVLKRIGLLKPDDTDGRGEEGPPEKTDRP